MANPVLDVKNLTKEFPGFKLDNISFSIPEGSIMGLIGENGAGKSTTISLLLDLMKKDEGNVRFWNQELSSSQKLKEIIGVVFDNINFYETLTPLQVGKISSSAYENWDQELYLNYLRIFEIEPSKPISKLSKGMKMKLSIAVALSHHPKLLILDEAFSGLDPISRDDLQEILLDFIQEEDHSVLLSSHNTLDLEKIADYITFIHKGKLIFTKPKDELLYTFGIVRCGKELFEKLDQDEIFAFKKEDYQYSVLVKDKEKIKRDFKEAVIDNPTIDEILLLYIKGEQPA